MEKKIGKTKSKKTMMRVLKGATYFLDNFERYPPVTKFDKFSKNQINKNHVFRIQLSIRIIMQNKL